MVFEIQNKQQAKEMLKFAIENDYEFDVDEGSIYDLFIRDEIIDQLEWIHVGDEFINAKYNLNELREFVVKQVKSDIEYEIGIWDELDEYIYDKVYAALYVFKERKEKQ